RTRSRRLIRGPTCYQGRPTPNPHKALEVKRKDLPRPRGAAFSLAPFLRGHGSGGRARPQRPGLLSLAGGTPGPGGRGRAAPNTPADSGGPAPRGQAAVPGNGPRPVPLPIRSQARGPSKSGGLLSLKGEAS